MYHLEMAFLIPLAMLPYLVPSIVAVGRRHHLTGDIVLINSFLGWTVFGWLYAYRMALSPVIADTTVRPQVQRRGPVQIDEEADTIL